MASWLDGLHLPWFPLRQSESHNSFLAAPPLFVPPRRKEKMLSDTPLHPRTTHQHFLSKAPQSLSA